MQKNIHIEFKVIPTPGPGWGTNNRVDISIPKRKFKSLGQVYDLWYNKTGNVAKEIVMGKEKEMA
jgi:hypothetical protein